MDRLSSAPFGGNSAVVSEDGQADIIAAHSQGTTGDTLWTPDTLGDVTRLSSGGLASFTSSTDLPRLTTTSSVYLSADHATYLSDQDDDLSDGTTPQITDQEPWNELSANPTHVLTPLQTSWKTTQRDSTTLLPESVSNSDLDRIFSSAQSIPNELRKDISLKPSSLSPSEREVLHPIRDLTSRGETFRSITGYKTGSSGLTFPIYSPHNSASYDESRSDTKKERIEGQSTVKEDYIAITVTPSVSENSNQLTLVRPSASQDLDLQSSTSNGHISVEIKSLNELETSFSVFSVKESGGSRWNIPASATLLLTPRDNPEEKSVSVVRLKSVDSVIHDIVNSVKTLIISQNLNNDTESFILRSLIPVSEVHPSASDAFTENYENNNSVSTPASSQFLRGNVTSDINFSDADDDAANDNVPSKKVHNAILNDIAKVTDIVTPDANSGFSSHFHTPNLDGAKVSVSHAEVLSDVLLDLTSAAIKTSASLENPHGVSSSYREDSVEQNPTLVTIHPKDSFKLEPESIPFVEITPTVSVNTLSTVAAVLDNSNSVSHTFPEISGTTAVSDLADTSTELVSKRIDEFSDGSHKTSVADRLSSEVILASASSSDFTSSDTLVLNSASLITAERSDTGIAYSVTKNWNDSYLDAPTYETLGELDTTTDSVPSATVTFVAAKSLEPSSEDLTKSIYSRGESNANSQVSFTFGYLDIAATASVTGNRLQSTGTFESSFIFPSFSYQTSESHTQSNYLTPSSAENRQTSFLISEYSRPEHETFPSLGLTEQSQTLNDDVYRKSSDNYTSVETSTLSLVDSAPFDITLALQKVTLTTQTAEIPTPVTSVDISQTSFSGSNIFSHIADMDNVTSTTSGLQPSSTTTYEPISAESTTMLVIDSTNIIPPMNNPLPDPKTDTLSPPITRTEAYPSSLLPTPAYGDDTPGLAPTPTTPVTSSKTSLVAPNIFPRVTSVSYDVSTPISSTPKTPAHGVTTENGGTSSEPSSDMKTAVVIASACAVFTLVLFLVLAIVCIRRKRKAKSHPPRQRGDELWVDLNSSNPAHQMPLPSLTTCGSQTEIAVSVKPENLYKVHFPFKGQQEGQMSLKEGDILQLVEKTSNGWWRGVSIKDGTSGWFPSSFVTLISSSTDDLTREKPKPSSQPNSPLVCRVKPQRQVSSFQIKKTKEDKEDNIGLTYPVLEANEGLDHVECWVNMAASVSMTSLPTTEMSYSTNITDYNTAVVGHRFRAVYAYKPVCKGEMALKEGEMIVCKERDRNGWMLGSKPKTNEEGWFPAVYVDEISSDDEMFGSSDVPDTYDLLESNKLHKLDQCWVGIEHSAQYGYESTVLGDLNLEPGDVITVLQTLANGWWFGVRGDNCGWFPGSYVEMVEDDSPSTQEENRSDQTNGSKEKQIGEHSTSEQTSDISAAANPTNKTELSTKPDNQEQASLSRSEEQTEPVQLPSGANSSNIKETGDNTSNDKTNHQIPLDDTRVNSKKIIRPNRHAPPPPPGAPASNSAAKLGQSAGNAEKPGESVRRPARPAPPPPKRKDSKVSKDSVKSGGTVHDEQKPNTPKAPGVAKPVILIRGKRPKLKKIPRKQLDDKQLNPMIRPSTRPFVPTPSDAVRSSWMLSDNGHKNLSPFISSPDDGHKTSSQSISDDFSKELMTILNQPHHKDGLSSHHLSPSDDTLHAPTITDDGRSSSRASLDSRSDSKVTSPSLSSHPSSTQGHSPNREHAELTQSKSLGSNFPRRRSLTPDSKRERCNSPVLLTTGNLLQNVKRFNKNLRNASPVPSVDSDKGSVKSSSTIKGEDTSSIASSRGFGKRNGRRHRTLTTVPPPRVPPAVSNKQSDEALSNGHHEQNSGHRQQNGQLSGRDVLESENFGPKSTAVKQSSQRAGADFSKDGENTRRPSNTLRPGEAVPARDSMVVVPGKVSEIVHQLNSLTPLERELLEKQRSHKGDTEMTVFSAGKKSNFGVEESVGQETSPSDPNLQDEPGDASTTGGVTLHSNGDRPTLPDEGTQL